MPGAGTRSGRTRARRTRQPDGDSPAAPGDGARSAGWPVTTASTSSVTDCAVDPGRHAVTSTRRAWLRDAAGSPMPNRPKEWRASNRDEPRSAGTLPVLPCPCRRRCLRLLISGQVAVGVSIDPDVDERRASLERVVDEFGKSARHAQVARFSDGADEVRGHDKAVITPMNPVHAGVPSVWNGVTPE